MNEPLRKINYGAAIREGFQYLLSNYPEVFVIGQGLWAPWYVGSSMFELEKEFGKERIIDSPISEAACTGAALGASLRGSRPIVVHPRLDFMILAIDQIVTQAANWSGMFGGKSSPGLTIRGIINRGGEQGAQHAQALHAWFAHVPGIRVVMPATPEDARDLLIASVLDDSPVLYIDNRWLYDLEQMVGEPVELNLDGEGPKVRREGEDLTLVGVGHSVELCLESATALAAEGISCEVVDLRIINPLDCGKVIRSVEKTGRLCVVDGGFRPCGIASEVIASVTEKLTPSSFRAPPSRVTLPQAPAPTSQKLEDIYFTKATDICDLLRKVVGP